MSSNCPPQLHLSLPPNSTSFKRSFEQFGFDLEESPVQGTGSDSSTSSGTDGNDRNKRARSATSFSDDDLSTGSSQSSAISSSSSSSPGTSLSLSVSGNEADGPTHSAGLSTTRPSDVNFGAPHHFPLSLTRASLEPPRLPTPEIQDIDMTDYPLVEDDDDDDNDNDEDDDEENESFHDAPSSPVPTHQPQTSSDDAYLLSLERFNAFDRQISALRRSHSPPPIITPRAPAVPPVLPPLSLLEDGERESELIPGASTSSFVQGQRPPPSPWSAALSQTFYTGNAFYSGPTPWDGASHDRDHRDHRDLENHPRVPSDVQIRDEGSNARGNNSTARVEFNLPSPTFPRFSPISVPFSTSSSLEHQGEFEFSPDVLWGRYDDTPSPSTDNSEHEHERSYPPLSGRTFTNVVPSLDELRSSSPLFRVDDLDGDDELSPSASSGSGIEARADNGPNTSTNTNTSANPPTLPPLPTLHSHSNDSIENVINESWSDTAFRSSVTRLRAAETVRRAERDLDMSSSSGSRSRSRSRGSGSVSGEPSWMRLLGSRPRHPPSLSYLEGLSEQRHPTQSSTTGLLGNSSLTLNRHENGNANTNANTNSTTTNAGTVGNPSGTATGHNASTTRTSAGPGHGLAEAYLFVHGLQGHGQASETSPLGSEWTQDPGLDPADLEWFNDYLGRLSRDPDVDMDVDTSMERPMDWADSDEEARWRLREFGRVRERVRARARLNEIERAVERDAERERERQREREREWTREAEREAEVELAGWRERERVREREREREREGEFITNFGTMHNPFRRSSDNTGIQEVLAALQATSSASSSSSSLNLNLNYTELGNNNSSNGSGSGGSNVNRNNNTSPHGPRPLPQRAGSHELLETWRMFDNSGSGGNGSNSRARARASSSSPESESLVSPSALPLPPRLQPLDEELSFGRFGASPGPGPDVGASGSPRASASANADGNMSGNRNETRLSAWRMLDSGASGPNSTASGGQRPPESPSSTVPRLQRPSLPLLGLEALYEAGASDRSGVPLNEHLLELEGLDRLMDRDGNSDQSPREPGHNPIFGEPLPWRELYNHDPNQNHDQERSSFSSFSSSSSGGDSIPAVPTNPAITRMPSTPAHLHPQPHPRHTSISTFDQRRRETRALGPRPISRDTGTNTDWGEVVNRNDPHRPSLVRPRIGVSERPSSHVITAARPTPRVSANASTGPPGFRAGRRPYLNINTVPEPASRSTGRPHHTLLLPRWDSTSVNTSTNTHTSPTTSRVPEPPWQTRSFMLNRQSSTNTRANTNTNTSPVRPHFNTMRPLDRHSGMLGGRGQSTRHAQSPPSSTLVDHVMDIDDVFAMQRERDNFSSNSASVDRRADPWVATANGSSGPANVNNNNNNGRPHSPVERASGMYAHLIDRMRQNLYESDTAVTSMPMEEERSRPASEFPVSENLFSLPSVPSPGLGGIFDHGSHHDNPDSVNETEQNRRRSSAPSPPSMYRLARGSYVLPARRRSPSPTREEQASRIPPSLRSRSPPHGNSGPARFDPQSFTPGPFRNTMQRMFEMNARHENSENRLATHRNNAPSIPPLPFEGDFSPTRAGPSSSRQESPTSPQAPRAPRVWHEPTLSTDSNRLSSAEVADRYGNREWWERPLPRQPRRNVPRVPPSGPDPSPRVSQLRQAADVHNILTRQQRMEAARIADSTDTSQNPLVRDIDIEGLSHAIDVLRHDGLSSPRSRQLINRYHSEREQSNAETGSTPSTSSSSPWGVFDTWNRTEDHPPVPSHRVRGARVPSTVESDLPRHRDSWELERETQMRQRRGRFSGHHGGFGPAPMFPSGGPLREYLGRLGRRGRAMGDYVRDEDFDESYESLISLAQTLGEAKPRATPESVISALETGKYKDWRTPDSDQRCPICLDDYQPDDPVLKLADCSHWLHRGCLQQWLKGASTCPVCRKAVGGSSRRSTPHHHHHIHHHHSNQPSPGWRHGDPGSGPGSGSTSATSNSGSHSSFLTAWRHGA